MSKQWSSIDFSWDRMEPPIEGRQLNEPIIVEDILNGRSIRSLQPIFPLTELDFHKLQRGTPITASAAAMVFSAVVGFVVGLGPKLMMWMGGAALDVTAGESATVVAGVLISLLIYVAGFLIPSEQKQTAKKIKKFFKDQLASTNSPGGVS